MSGDFAKSTEANFKVQLALFDTWLSHSQDLDSLKPANFCRKGSKGSNDYGHLWCNGTSEDAWGGGCLAHGSDGSCSDFEGSDGVGVGLWCFTHHNFPVRCAQRFEGPSGCEAFAWSGLLRSYATVDIGDCGLSNHISFSSVIHPAKDQSQCQTLPDSSVACTSVWNDAFRVFSSRRNVWHSLFVYTQQYCNWQIYKW